MENNKILKMKGDKKVKEEFILNCKKNSKIYASLILVIALSVLLSVIVEAGGGGGKPVCNFWAKGNCRNGQNCRFAHPTGGGPSSSSQGRRQPQQQCRASRRGLLSRSQE